MSYGCVPTWIVAVTRSVAGSIRWTVEVPKFISQSEAAPKVIPHGPPLTAIRFTTLLVAGSIRTTWSSPNTVAHAEPEAIATEQGWAPTLIFARTSTFAAEP